MAAEYEPSGRGFIDQFFPQDEPPHADYLVDDPLYLAQCKDYPSCIATTVIALVTLVLGICLLVIQFQTDSRSVPFGFERIRYINKRIAIVATLLLVGWVLPLIHQYNSWQLVTDFFLYNNSVLLIASFTAVWYEFFVLSWEVHRIRPMSILGKTLWWTPAASCLVLFNVHLFVAALADIIWPRIVLYYTVFVMGVLWLLFGWIYTCQLTRMRRIPAEEFSGALFRKYSMIARLHYSTVWATVILMCALAAMIVRAHNLTLVGWEDRYFSLYMDDTLAHFCAAVFQSSGVMLMIYSGWSPAREK